MYLMLIIIAFICIWFLKLYINALDSKIIELREIIDKRINQMETHSCTSLRNSKNIIKEGNVWKYRDR